MKERFLTRGRHAGFTIIELMLVIAILAILAVIAVGAYQDYTKRTKVIELMLAAAACKNNVFEAYYHGVAPAPGNWGCERAGSGLVASLTVDPNGMVTVVAQGIADDVDGEALTLTPMDSGVPAAIASGFGDKLEWRCGAAADGTTIPMRYLPSNCRH